MRMRSAACGSAADLAGLTVEWDQLLVLLTSCCRQILQHRPDLGWCLVQAQRLRQAPLLRCSSALRALLTCHARMGPCSLAHRSSQLHVPACLSRPTPVQRCT